jgi:hypothetical protein
MLILRNYQQTNSSIPRLAIEGTHKVDQDQVCFHLLCWRLGIQGGPCKAVRVLHQSELFRDSESCDFDFFQLNFLNSLLGQSSHEVFGPGTGT